MSSHLHLHRGVSNGGKGPSRPRSHIPIVPICFCVIMLSVSGLQFYVSTLSIQQNVVQEQYPQPPSTPLADSTDRSGKETTHRIQNALEEEGPPPVNNSHETTAVSDDPEDEEENQLESKEFLPGIVAKKEGVAPPRVVRWRRQNSEGYRFAYFATTTSVATPPSLDYDTLREEEEYFYNATESAAYYEEDQPNPIKEAMVQKFLDECVPMAAWQTQSFPTCNTLHEMDIASAASSTNTANETEYESNTAEFQNDFEISLLSDQGSWRSVWKVQRDLSWSLSDSSYANISSSDGMETLVLKLLKFQRRDFNAESYEHHRVDALAMERLTASSHIVNLYGYCGQSVVTEYASTTARLLTKDTTLTSLDRLKMGRDIVQAMMDLHSMDYPNATNITFTHNDLNMANAVAVQGRIKLNDFNIGVMQRWNKTTNAICKTPVLFEAPLWKSPEEIVSSERIKQSPEDEPVDATNLRHHPALNTDHWVLAGPTDVFGLGNLLFQVLTKRQPWTHLEPDGAKNASDAGRRKVRGEQPFVPPKYHAHNTSKVALAALHYAVMLCYRTDPTERPTSYQLWKQLNTAIDWIEERGGKIYPRELEDLFLGRSEVKMGMN